MNKRTISVAAIIVVVVAIAIFLVPRFTVEQPELPATLGSLQLNKAFTGDEARTIINKLHGKGVTPRENSIGVYGDSFGGATLYLSVYKEQTEAEKVLAKMIAGIETGFTPFSDFERRSVEGQDVFYCIGEGQAHYFFAVDTALYWLAVDFRFAQKSLEALLKSLKPSSMQVEGQTHDAFTIYYRTAGAVLHGSITNPAAPD